MRQVREHLRKLALRAHPARQAHARDGSRAHSPGHRVSNRSHLPRAARFCARTRIFVDVCRGRRAQYSRRATLKLEAGKAPTHRAVFKCCNIFDAEQLQRPRCDDAPSPPGTMHDDASAARTAAACAIISKLGALQLPGTVARPYSAGVRTSHRMTGSRACAAARSLGAIDVTPSSSSTRSPKTLLGTLKPVAMARPSASQAGKPPASPHSRDNRRLAT